jgi:hypothetical protein
VVVVSGAVVLDDGSETVDSSVVVVASLPEVVGLVDGSATASVVEVARSALLTGATARASTAEATRPEIG